MTSVRQSVIDQPRSVRRSEVLWLCGIVALGAALRTYIWFHGYAHYGIHGLVRHGDGYLQMAASLGGRSSEGFFTHWRFYQVVYSFYLAPLFALNLSDSVYVFWLHHVFAAATICLIYVSARKLGGSTCGLLAALVYAVHLQVAYWFNWTLADTAFHFHLSLFLLCAVVCWEGVSIKKIVGLAGAAFLMIFTRPEGFFITAALAASRSVFCPSGLAG